MTPAQRIDAPSSDAVPEWAKRAAEEIHADVIKDGLTPSNDATAMATIIARHAPSPAAGEGALRERLEEMFRQDTHLNAAGRSALVDRVISALSNPAAPSGNDAGENGALRRAAQFVVDTYEAHGLPLTPQCDGKEDPHCDCGELALRKLSAALAAMKGTKT